MERQNVLATVGVLELACLGGGHGLVCELLVPGDGAGLGVVGAVRVVECKPHPGRGITGLGGGTVDSLTRALPSFSCE